MEFLVTLFGVRMKMEKPGMLWSSAKTQLLARLKVVWVLKSFRISAGPSRGGGSP